MIRTATIYKTDENMIAVVVLVEKKRVAVIYGDDYSVDGPEFGNFVENYITVKCNGVVVGCVSAEELINEIWKGVPEL